MYPTLIRFGPIHIKSYGLMMAISFIVIAYFAYWRGTKKDIKNHTILHLFIYMLPAGILGARLHCVITHWANFRGNPLRIINPFQNGKIGIQGLSMHGGVILAILVGIIYIKKKKLDLWKITDICAPSSLLGIAIIRVGCFLNGCCFGKPCEHPWCMIFPPESLAGWTFPGTKIHPSQLYSTLGGIILFFSILYLEKYKSFDGFTFWMTVALYSSLRLFIDFTRYYESRIAVFKIGSYTLIDNQIISLIVILIAIVFMLYLKKQKHRRLRLE